MKKIFSLILSILILSISVNVFCSCNSTKTDSEDSFVLICSISYTLVNGQEKTEYSTVTPHYSEGQFNNGNGWLNATETEYNKSPDHLKFKTCVSSSIDSIFASNSRDLFEKKSINGIVRLTKESKTISEFTVPYVSGYISPDGESFTNVTTAYRLNDSDIGKSIYYMRSDEKLRQQAHVTYSYWVNKIYKTTFLGLKYDYLYVNVINSQTIAIKNSKGITTNTVSSWNITYFDE